jgi:hypothetical protein
MGGGITMAHEERSLKLTAAELVALRQIITESRPPYDIGRGALASLLGKVQRLEEEWASKSAAAGGK